MVAQLACKNNSPTNRDTLLQGKKCLFQIIQIINENNFKDNAVLIELVVILKQQ